MTSDELVTALGRAVAGSWSALNNEAREILFEAAVRTTGEQGREQLATFLRFPRRGSSEAEHSVRAVPEPDSLGG